MVGDHHVRLLGQTVTLPTIRSQTPDSGVLSVGHMGFGSSGGLGMRPLCSTMTGRRPTMCLDVRPSHDIACDHSGAIA